MSPVRVSVGEEGEGHSMLMDREQKRRGNQQWRVWCEEYGGWEYQKRSGVYGRVCKVEDSHGDSTPRVTSGSNNVQLLLYQSLHMAFSNESGLCNYWVICYRISSVLTGEREKARESERTHERASERERERERERVCQSEFESEWFTETGYGPMSVVVTNTVKQL